jgi:hypothetical protein
MEINKIAQCSKMVPGMSGSEIRAALTAVNWDTVHTQSPCLSFQFLVFFFNFHPNAKRYLCSLVRLGVCFPVLFFNSKVGKNFKQYRFVGDRVTVYKLISNNIRIKVLHLFVHVHG